MSGNRGVFRVAKSQLDDFAGGKARAITCVSYDTSDGMPSTECRGGSQPAGWRARDGRLWFPTTRGAVVIDPHNLKTNTLVPPVKIELIQAQGQQTAPASSPRFSAGTTNLEFHYTALSLIAPERVRFRYMLEGTDPDWTDAGTRRVAYYTNLPPGSYRFRVAACNNDGIWNEAGAFVDFRIEPHLYQTYWFYGICILTCLLAAQSLHLYRVRRLKSREQELTARVNDAMARIKILSGLLPICASCRRIRDDQGRWNQIELYIRDHSQADFSHGCCPDCARKLYPDIYDKIWPAE